MTTEHTATEVRYDSGLSQHDEAKVTRFHVVIQRVMSPSNRAFVVEWRNFHPAGDAASTPSLRVVEMIGESKWLLFEESVDRIPAMMDDEFVRRLRESLDNLESA